MIFRNKTVNEELFVPVARHLRYRRVIKLLPKGKNISMVDFGCDPEMSFYMYCKNQGVKIDKFAGIDPLLDKSVLKKYKGNNKIILKKEFIRKDNRLPKNSFDYAISLALLEHLEKPNLLIENAIGLLKKGGRFVFTTPTPFAKPILETLSFRLHLLSSESIADHKNYFNKKTLDKLLSKYNNIAYTHKYFDFGVNNLVVVTKR